MSNLWIPDPANPIGFYAKLGCQMNQPIPKYALIAKRLYVCTRTIDPIAPEGTAPPGNLGRIVLCRPEGTTAETAEESIFRKPNGDVQPKTSQQTPKSQALSLRKAPHATKSRSIARSSKGATMYMPTDFTGRTGELATHRPARMSGNGEFARARKSEKSSAPLARARHSHRSRMLH